MAKLPTPEENARAVLEIFAHFGRRAGEVLQMRNFISDGLRPDDVVSGLEAGIERGWFEETDRGSFRLTDAGFAEM